MRSTWGPFLALLAAGLTPTRGDSAEGRLEVGTPQSTAEAAAAARHDSGLKLRVDEVVVYSDRARVVRAGETVLRGGAERLKLGTLSPRVLPESVRLEAAGARVLRVEVQRSVREALPRTDAQQLLRDLEVACETERTLVERRRVLEREVAFLRGLRPSASASDPKLGPVPLETSGWRAAVSFLATRDAADGEAIRRLDAELTAQRRKTEGLRARARQLATGVTGEPGYEVEAILEGQGTARLRLSYLAHGARWYPSYDVRYAPGSSEVEVAFAGLVSQETGEDWDESRLILSTAVPATTATLPKLLAWKIGEKDQFIPTPVAQPEPPRRPLATPRPASVEGQPHEEEVLRARLLAAAEGEVETNAGVEQPMPPPMPPAPPHGAAAPPPMRHQPVPLTTESRRSRAPSAPSMAPPMPSAAPELDAPGMYDRSAAVAVSGKSYETGSARVSDGPAVSFGAPRSYHPPVFNADLPASLAGGYDFTYVAARRESVRSGGEARRVALHTARLPAQPLLVILPALSKQAYLVADVVNASDRPLLQGGANLYVGADLQGQAALPTTAVGEKWTVPLGVDDAIQVVRNVRLLTAEKGLFSKEGVNAYEVEIELLNPRPRPIEARVVDQIPLKGDKHVEVRLDESAPTATKHDPVEGTLEWRLPLAPKQKRVVRFRYTVTHPKGARLRQW